MNKLALLLLASLFSVSSFAVSLSHKPATPVVFTANASYGPPENPTVIYAPWFHVNYEVTADQLITIVGIQEIVTSNLGETQAFFMTLPEAVEVPAGGSFQSEYQYLQSLPRNVSHVYNVDVRLIGWVGGKDSKGELLNVSESFVTE